MPEYRVSMSRECTEHLVVKVEAIDEEAAKAAATLEGESGKHDWKCNEYSETEIFSVDATGK